MENYPKHVKTVAEMKKELVRLKKFHGTNALNSAKRSLKDAQDLKRKAFLKQRNAELQMAAYHFNAGDISQWMEYLERAGRYQKLTKRQIMTTVWTYFADERMKQEVKKAKIQESVPNAEFSFESDGNGGVYLVTQYPTNGNGTKESNDNKDC